VQVLLVEEDQGATSIDAHAVGRPIEALPAVQVQAARPPASYRGE
jgi:hypothetical protein